MRGCCDVFCSNGGQICKAGCEGMVTLNYRTSIAHHHRMGWVSVAPGGVTTVSQYCRTHRTVCPENPPIHTVLISYQIVRWTRRGGGAWMQQTLQHHKAKEEALWVRARKEVTDGAKKRKRAKS